jgi:histidinol phosphatase-like enzyme
MGALGLVLVVITNQSAISRGIIDKNRLDKIHQRMCGLLKKKGVFLTAFISARMCRKTTIHAVSLP